MQVKVYTDASHSPEHKVAACGYVIIIGGEVVKHEVVLAELNLSSDAESYACCLGILEASKIEGVLEIRIFCDHQTCVKIINNETVVRNRIKDTYFKRLKETVNFIKATNIQLSAKKVRAHHKDTLNKKVDYSVRKELRNHIFKMNH